MPLNSDTLARAATARPLQIQLLLLLVKFLNELLRDVFVLGLGWGMRCLSKQQALFS